MATAARSVMARQPRIVTLLNGKEIGGKEAERVRIEASYWVQAGTIVNGRAELVEREKYRPLDVSDRPSVRRAMLAVETQLVAALWTLARLPGGGGSSGSCGLAYIQDATDRWANAVEKGWERTMPRPPVPSGRAIDAMHVPLGWLSLLPKDQAQLVSVAGGTKRGDVDRNVSWSRVRCSLPQTCGQTVRTLQRRYEGGIREIVAKLTESALTNRS